MPNVGYATLQIIPSVRGISDELRRQLVGPAGDAGGDAGDAAGGGLKEKLKVGAAAAGAAAGALLVAGIGEAMEQANITSTLQAQLGATGKEAARYGKVAGQLYSKGITEDVAQGAEVIRSIVNAGLVPPDATNKQLQSIATKMQDVSTTFGTDMSMQTQAVSALMKNGLAPNAKGALDIITVGMQKLGPNAEDLLETFQEYPVQLKKLGLDAQTSMGLFQQGLKGGARDTDIVADSLKEFSIRAIDMSSSSQDAYKLLGLSATDMSQQIAKGGKGATEGLQTVLDKLRGIKDPVKRNAAAVGLFGTQAEELGTALFKLDPSTATKGLGDMGGAASKLSKTLHSGPSYEIQTFTRTLKQGFVDFIGGRVLPVIALLARGLNTYLMPPIRVVASVVAGTLVAALKALFSAGMAVGNWLRSMGAWLIPIGIAVAGFTAAILAQQIATAATTAVFAVYRGAILAWTAVQRGATIAQAAFNAVMNANVIVLVITAIVALGAALVVAYQKSETFRSIVQGAWQGIQTAAMWAWNNALKPVVAALVAGWNAIVKGALWLWGILKPVFSFISTAVRIVATIIGVVLVVAFKVAWTIIKTYFTLLKFEFLIIAAVAKWLWANVLSPVIGWIVAGFKLLWAGIQIYFGYMKTAIRAVGTVAKWLWTNAISPVVRWVVAGVKLLWAGVQIYFGYVKTAFRAVGTVAKWLWHNVISPVFKGIGTIISWWWTNVIQRIFNFVKSALRALGTVFKWLYTNVIKPVWDKIKSAISTVWTGIKPIFNALKTAVRKVGESFESARKAIKTAWDKVQSIAKKPVSFIVNTVYPGIRGVWNKVASAFGAPKLPEFHPKGFASGGILPGYTPGKDVHRFYSPSGMGLELSGGEAIMRPEFTRAVGSGFVGAMNSIAKTRGAQGVKKALAPVFGGNPDLPTDTSLKYARGGTIQRFADGGIFGWIGKGLNKVAGAGSAIWNKVKEGAKWLKDSIAASARAGIKNVVDPLLSKFPGMSSGFGKMIRKIPDKVIKTIFGFSEQADKKGGAGGLGGPRIQAALKWARTQAGKKYQWGGNGNPSWDCSGFMSAIESVIRGQKPHRRWATMAFHGATAPPGWVKNGASAFKIGITNAGVGHTAGTLGKTNVESRGGDGVVVGSRARGYKAGLFNSWYGFMPGKYDSGGWLQPGLTAAINKTGRPEAVLTATQWNTMNAAASRASQPVVVEVHTRDEALAQFIDVRVQDHDQELVSVIRAG